MAAPPLDDNRPEFISRWDPRNLQHKTLKYILDIHGRTLALRVLTGYLFGFDEGPVGAIAVYEMIILRDLA